MRSSRNNCWPFISRSQCRGFLAHAAKKRKVAKTDTMTFVLPKFMTQKSLQHSPSRRSLWGQQQESVDVSTTSNLDPSKLQFYIVSIVVSEQANLCGLQKMAVVILASHVWWLFVHSSFFETDSGSMNTGAPSNPSDGGRLQHQVCTFLHQLCS